MVYNQIAFSPDHSRGMKMQQTIIVDNTAEDQAENDYYKNKMFSAQANTTMTKDKAPAVIQDNTMLSHIFMMQNSMTADPADNTHAMRLSKISSYLQAKHSNLMDGIVRKSTTMNMLSDKEKFMMAKRES